jgi:hypothetical protein
LDGIRCDLGRLLESLNHLEEALRVRTDIYNWRGERVTKEELGPLEQGFTLDGRRRV